MSVNQLSVIGINYKKSDAASRGKFAINTEQYISILQTAAQLAIAEIFVVSTCNRTEVYVLNGDVPTVIQLLC